ncbi:MAG: hypothetical protein KAI66_04045, partial [Lentisphaeria bacterium]|nr:hypothetical protein [Lentisphaeria bacterium]
MKNITELIDGILAYLVRCQEPVGEFAGSIWSELAYHNPLVDYRAGGSHHNRTVGGAGLAFTRLAATHPDSDLMHSAERAFDWVVTRQHEDGGMFEITNGEAPSQFHLPYERSSISLGIVCHGLYGALLQGLPAKNEYREFLIAAARWQLTVETTPGNFLHTEGYPPEKLVLNASAHAAETLLVAGRLTTDPVEQSQFHAAAERAVKAILKSQRKNGMFPYSDIPDDNSISYSATVCWALQNLIDLALLPGRLLPRTHRALAHGIRFLETCVNDDGSIGWEEWETHGQKYHTWVYGQMARVLTWSGSATGKDKAEALIAFMRRELYNPHTKLCRLYDFPVGQQRLVAGRSVLSEDLHECAYHQADLLECLIDVRSSQGAAVGGDT